MGDMDYNQQPPSAAQRRMAKIWDSPRWVNDWRHYKGPKKCIACRARYRKVNDEGVVFHFCSLVGPEHPRVGPSSWCLQFSPSDHALKVEAEVREHVTLTDLEFEREVYAELEKIDNRRSTDDKAERGDTDGLE